ncbi:MAG TPA: hypothetical protein VGG92_20520 [Caulobacteraceae bacterium]|jgi:hypothetical protein
MSVVDIFYQGEHGREIEVAEAALAETLAALKGRLGERHGYTAEVLVFVEDEDEPLSDEITIEVIVERGGKLHFHHCREVEVTVGFAGKRHSRTFAPSATVARVKTWAAEAFNMTAHDAGEHVLQIAGTHDRPSPAAHIGALAGKVCKIAFDLVADERINGAPEEGARR